MGLFTNPFLSLAGQKERLINAGKSIAGAVQNIGSTLTLGAIPKVKFEGNVIATKIAQNPVQTAAVIATVANPAGAVAAAKLVATKAAAAVKSVVSSLSPTQKVLAAVATPIAAGAIVSSKKLQSGIATAPSSLANFGSNIGKLVDKPSIKAAKELITENPVLTGITAAGALAVVGGGIGLAANTIATMRNSSATAKNSQIMEVPTAPAVAQIVTQPQEIRVIQPVAASPLVEEKPKEETKAITTMKAKPKKKAKKKKKKATPKKKKKVAKKAKKKAKPKKKAKKKSKSLKRKKKKRSK